MYIFILIYCLPHANEGDNTLCWEVVKLSDNDEDKIKPEAR